MRAGDITRQMLIEINKVGLYQVYRTIGACWNRHDKGLSGRLQNTKFDMQHLPAEPSNVELLILYLT